MKKHTTSIRVRYQETDTMGVVYYANYLVWFEIARTEYMRALGHPYRELESHGTHLMVVEAQCRYKSPARYDDFVEIAAWISSVKNCSLTFEYTVSLNGRLIADGNTGHVFVDKKGKPTKIPQALRGSIPT